MKNVKSLFFSALMVASIASADDASFEDKRDGKKYHKVNLGSEWVVENLNFKSKNSYCYNDTPSCDENGRLYTWEVAMSVCPEGYRLPTDEEWKSLLESKGGWNGAVKQGLKFPMAGDRRSDGAYHYLGESAFYWSATPSKKKYIRYKFESGKLTYDRSPMVDGPAYSVKCIAGAKPCNSPLMNAVRMGDTKKVKFLLESGASVNEKCSTENPKEMTSLGEDYEDISLLGMAIDKGNVELVRLLLNNGADPDIVDVSGPSDEAHSMLTRALLKGSKDVLKLLLEKGMSLGFCDVALSTDAKEDLLLYIVGQMDPSEYNKCWSGMSLLDIFNSFPRQEGSQLPTKVIELLKIRGAKSGKEFCSGDLETDINNGIEAYCGD